MRTMIVALLSAFLAFAALPAAAQTTGDAWVLVGEKRIGRGVNSTTLELPNKAFTKIRISLKNESIVLYDMRMEFSNDTFEDIDLGAMRGSW